MRNYPVRPGDRWAQAISGKKAEIKSVSECEVTLTACPGYGWTSEEWAVPIETLQRWWVIDSSAPVARL